MVHTSTSIISGIQAGYIDLMDYLFGEELRKWDEHTQFDLCQIQLQVSILKYHKQSMANSNLHYLRKCVGYYDVLQICINFFGFGLKAI